MTDMDYDGELVHIGPYAMVPAWVYSHPALNDSARTVYGVLATFANADRCAWPSRAVIAERCGKDVGSVGRALKVLTDAGVLVVENRKWADSGVQRSSVYRLAVIDPRGSDPERDIDDPGRDIAQTRSAISRKPEARYRASKNKTIRTKPEELNQGVRCAASAQTSLLGDDTIDGLAPAGAVPDRFEQFWDAYQHKVGKPGALKAWKRLVTKERMPPETIIAAAKAWAAYYQAKPSPGEFIPAQPYPATFLNDRRFDNTPPSRKTLARDAIVERTGETMNMKMVGGKLVPA